MPSKLGIHAILAGETLKILQQLVAVNSPMTSVKSVDGVGWLKEAKAISPTTITVGRFTEGTADKINVEGPHLGDNLRKTAREVMESLAPKFTPHRAYVDYWEVINEQDPPGPDGHRKLAELMIHCMEWAEAEGYKLGLFSYSRGVPEWDEMKAVVETGVFGRAKAGGHMLSLHEYAYPMDQWFGEAMPGTTAHPDRGPLSCRYRWWYEDFLKPRNEVIPLYITEVNLAKHLPQVRVEEWMEQMKWYDARMREDYYVLGSHIFTLGSAGSWRDFEFGRMLPAMVDYMISVKDVEDPTWPEVEETPPTPEPGPEPPSEEPASTGNQPREAFERHYLLLPPDADWRWIAACERYWEAYRVTIGSSADDAGYGPGLSMRAVTAVNPSKWPDDLKTFFDKYYPGVKYDPVEVETPKELAWILNHRAKTNQRFG